MADTILKSITIRNWTTVREAAIEFPERGLVLVRGINSVAKGKMASIGSGKTALGEAISRTLFGVKGRYTQLGHYSYKGKGNAYVCVNCVHQGKPLKVEMGFKCQEITPTGEGFRFQFNGVDTHRDRLEHTREDLAKLLTVPADLAAWAVHLDGDALKFSDLSESKAVELLMAALMQPRWNVCLKQTNDKANELKHQLASEKQTIETAKEVAIEAEVELQTAQANLAEAKNVYAQEVKQTKAKLKQLEKEIADLAKTITGHQARMGQIKKEIEHRVAATAQKEKDCEIIVNEKQDFLDSLRVELSDLRIKEARAKGDLEHASSHLEAAKRTPANCPTCNKPWDKGTKAIQERTEFHNDALAAYNKAVEATKKKRLAEAKAQDAWHQAKTKLDEARAEQPIDELSYEYEKLETGLEPAQDALSDAQQEKIRVEQGPDKTSITTFETQVKEREKQLKKCQQAIEKAAAKSVETEELLRVVGYWQEAFGYSGIPNMVLGDALGPLNATSRRVSALMSGGTLDVSYSTTRQLKTGNDKAELTINVDNELGSHRADGSSKGEGGLNNLIIAETLAEVGGIAHRIGYRWYDEIGANQDEIVRRSIYTYLSEIARRYGILVFLVSHAPEAANYADYTLIAEKTGTGTTYRWG